MGSGKLTPELAKQMRELRADQNLLQKEIGAMYGVSQTTVSQVLRGIKFRDAGGPIAPIGAPWRFCRANGRPRRAASG